MDSDLTISQVPKPKESSDRAGLTAMDGRVVASSVPLSASKKGGVRSSQTVVGTRGEKWEPKGWEVVCGRHFISGDFVSESETSIMPLMARLSYKGRTSLDNQNIL